MLEFRVPRELYDVDFSELSLIIESEVEWLQPPTTALYDWSAEEWVELEEVQIGLNHIEDAGRFVGGHRRAVRVRLSATNAPVECLYPGLGLKGRRGT